MISYQTPEDEDRIVKLLRLYKEKMMNKKKYIYKVLVFDMTIDIIWYCIILFIATYLIIWIKYSSEEREKKE